MKQKIRYSVLIVEDEEPAVEILLQHMKAHPEIALKDIAGNGKEALRKLSSAKFDIVFMDIDIPALSGIEVLETVENPPYTIFTTASDLHAVKAFDLNAVDYLVKPFSAERFSRAVTKAIESIRKRDTMLTGSRALGLAFRENGARHLVPFEEIVYLSSHARHTVIHTEQRDYETPQSLSTISVKLPETQFVRIHKQHIVNLRFVSLLKYGSGGAYILIMKDSDSTPLPVGRTFTGPLRERMG